MLQEFKEFVNRGNVVDLAVALVLGAAFNPIITSIVDRLLMPLVGMAVGQPDLDRVGTFACTPLADPAAADEAAGVVVGAQQCAGSVGAVLTTTVDFLLVALALFFVVKAYNRLQRQKPEQSDAPAPAADPDEVVLLREIRDALTRP